VGAPSFGAGTGPIHLSDVGCNGDETRLIDCPNGGIGVHNFYSHNEDAGVVCQPSECVNFSIK